MSLSSGNRNPKNQAHWVKFKIVGPGGTLSLRLWGGLIASLLQLRGDCLNSLACGHITPYLCFCVRSLLFSYESPYEFPYFRITMTAF